jgi:peptidoglycan hydrolase CwlO-like protein
VTSTTTLIFAQALAEMNPAIVVPIFTAAIAGVIAAIGSYLAAARKMSGQISTTSADQLWAENTKMKEEYREQIKRLTDRVESLVNQNNGLHERINTLTVDFEECNNQLRAMIAKGSG